LSLLRYKTISRFISYANHRANMIHAESTISPSHQAQYIILAYRSYFAAKVARSVHSRQDTDDGITRVSRRRIRNRALRRVASSKYTRSIIHLVIFIRCLRYTLDKQVFRCDSLEAEKCKMKKIHLRKNFSYLQCFIFLYLYFIFDGKLLFLIISIARQRKRYERTINNYVKFNNAHF